MHPLIKIIIEKRDLYHKKPKQIRSSLRDLMIPETYMPSKEQIGSFTATLRRKLVENFLKDNMDPIKKFVDDHSWNKAKKESDLICLESDLKYENFLLVVTSKLFCGMLLSKKDLMEKAIFTQMLHINYYSMDSVY